ncbi:LysR family transcriptional regulator [Marivibrio halodurans]|uniref:LysR family transcriptional regulator n=1 Tax=Marivibrio halodurans TaxID=2039722 RepID=A0A8J7S8U7_9PROT|nr:LysR substrate-binding domain-containing protein [Marivibrio halodurans]MBP5857527.1 LysR family transcriptional regulator [Marivibrio halodurans]
MVSPVPGPMLNLPPLKALLAFHAVATHARLADAARRLGVTESAVSHRIRQLERTLGINLFDRASGRLELTPTGRRYLERVEPALLQLHEATEALMPQTDRSEVRLTLPASLAVVWLIPRLAGFEAAHPGIDVQLVTTTRVMDLAREQIDLAIRYGRGNWPRVAARFLFDDLATPVAAPGYLSGESAVAEAFATARLITTRSIPGEWEEWAKARGLPPPRMEEALALDTVEQAIQVAEAGHGLAMGRAPYIRPRLDSGALVAPFGGVGPTGAAYYLCTPEAGTPRAPARRLMRWLEAEAGRYAEEHAGPGVGF